MHEITEIFRIDPSALGFSLLDDPATVRLQLTLTAPDGTTSSELQTTAKDLKKQCLLVGGKRQPLQPGRYTLEIIETHPDGRVTIHPYTIELVKLAGGKTP